jgi:tetratricopeptide (TPR) repeat protein
MRGICYWAVLASTTFRLSWPALNAAESNVLALTNGPPGNTEKAIAYRLKWNLDTLVGDYEKHGRHNPKWDESAKSALTVFAQTRALSGSKKVTEPLSKLPSAVRTAVTNGCDDPLLLYLSARFVTPYEKHSWKEHGEQYRLAAEGLSRGEYAPMRKFYGALRAAEALHPGGNTTPLEVHHWRREASRFLNESVADKTMPPAEVYEACDALFQNVKKNAVQLEQFYRALEPIIFKNWPSESSLYLLKGTFYVDYAWQSRGGAYARDVTDSGWTLFAQRLDEAEKALSKAWELNPQDERIAREMITVELGQGKGRPRMELWFKQATDLNPDYYDAFDAKLYYLEPKWYGSQEDMLEFGRECVASKKWGGHVPLILRDAHEKILKYLPAEEQGVIGNNPRCGRTSMQLSTNSSLLIRRRLGGDTTTPFMPIRPSSGRF